VYGKWTVKTVWHRESQLPTGSAISYDQGTVVSPVLVVVDCRCMELLKAAASRLLQYADGAEVAPAIRFSETEDTENDMSLARYEESLERQRLGTLQEELRKKNAKNQGNNAVKSHVSYVPHKIRTFNFSFTSVSYFSCPNSNSGKVSGCVARPHPWIRELGGRRGGLPVRSSAKASSTAVACGHEQGYDNGVLVSAAASGNERGYGNVVVDSAASAVACGHERSRSDGVFVSADACGHEWSRSDGVFVSADACGHERVYANAVVDSATSAVGFRHARRKNDTVVDSATSAVGFRHARRKNNGVDVVRHDQRRRTAVAGIQSA
jgi:hypothetical protein